MINEIHWGVVEDRKSDPLKLGRCRVRIVGLHTEDKTLLPTSDLPWAHLLLPTNSAAISGIGDTPVGIVEGSWVAVIFRDRDKQHPVIIGSVGGIPQEVAPSVVTTTTTTTTTPAPSTNMVDSDGTPVTTASAEPVTDAPSAGGLFKPVSLTMSAAGLALLKSAEGLASLSATKKVIGNDSTPANTTIYSYLDSVGVWTIGWGSTYLMDGVTKVNAKTTMTKAQADQLLLNSLATTFEASIKRNCRVLVTQSMFDACVNMVYNTGSSGLANSEFMSALNSTDYKAAYALIPGTKNLNGTLANRRKNEQTLFGKDGLPDSTGEILPGSTPSQTATPTQVLTPANVNTIRKSSTAGFADPAGTYPRKDLIKEPDTNRLARAEKINSTVVFKKEAARVKNVSTAGGVTWSQPPVPYNAAYPMNKVYATESGHVREFDDTPGNERIHTYHKTGTFTEVDCNGTQVNRIIGDSYEIMDRNGFIFIRGNCNVTVQGNANVRVENDANFEVFGSLNMNANNVNINAAGTFKVRAGTLDLLKGAVGSFSPSGNPGIPPLTTPTRNSQADASYETPEEGAPGTFVAAQVKSGMIEPEDAQPQTKKEKEAAAVKKTAVPIVSSCELINKETEFTREFQLTAKSTLGRILGSGSSGIPTGLNYGKTPQEIICNLKNLAENVIEPIWEMYPNMIITNTWRSEAVNSRLVGASKTSDHLTGCAVDMQFSKFSRQDTYDAAIAIQKAIPNYDQILLEYKGTSMWVHVSFRSSGNRMEIRTIDVLNPKNSAAGKFILYSK